MALTIQKIKEYSGKHGIKYQIHTITFGASDTAGAVATGLAKVYHADYQPSTSDDHGIVYPNYSDGGTTKALGTVYISSVTGADTGRLFVVGTA